MQYLLTVLQQLTAVTASQGLTSTFFKLQGTEYQPYDVNEFVCKWKVLWSKIAALPNFESDLKNRIFVDVMNEPDSMDLKWESHNNHPGAHQLYLQTADALHSISPDGVLFMFEGQYVGHLDKVQLNQK